MAQHHSAQALERKRVQARELQESISRQVEALANSDQWRTYLDYMRSFHQYSFNNVMLLRAQLPTASRVAGFRQWQERGRQVRKGEKSLKIFGYATYKTKPEGDAADDTEQEPQRHVYFPVLSVFDVSQTDPMEGAPDEPAVTHLLTGSDEAGIFTAVRDWISAQGWSVRREPIAGTMNGYTLMNSREIVIDADLAPAQAAKTMIHETAHALLHFEQTREEYRAHRGITEVEAESVAYVVAGCFGLATSDYSIGYIAGWSGADTDVIRATAANVLRAAHTIIDGLDAAHTQATQAA